jgi:hypothetical protein
MKEETSDFRRAVLKLNEPRVHKVRNSLGVYDSYKWIRKNKWLDLPRPVTEHEFYSIIRQVNNLLAEALLRGEDILLPHRMGAIELRKYDARITLNGDKIITNLPIDWDRTLKLWSEDEEAYKERTLIKMEEKEIFKVFYNKRTANYENKSFMSFEVNRDLKRRLKQKIKNKAVDAFKI